MYETEEERFSDLEYVALYDIRSYIIKHIENIYIPKIIIYSAIGIIYTLCFRYFGSKLSHSGIIVSCVIAVAILALIPYYGIICYYTIYKESKLFKVEELESIRLNTPNEKWFNGNDKYTINRNGNDITFKVNKGTFICQKELHEGYEFVDISKVRIVYKGEILKNIYKEPIEEYIAFEIVY